MKLVHYYRPERGPAWGLADRGRVFELVTDEAAGGRFLASLLQWPDPVGQLKQAWAAVGRGESLPLTELEAASPGPDRAHLLPPIDLQEVWAAGVTYQRSRVARMEESEGAARFYDWVYEADRPELFFKGMRSRVAGPGGEVRLRRDARWNVPEPELAVLVSPQGRIVGYTLGNDMSSRDIEGENPLYLPQAKVYRQSCALGPVILLEEEWREHREFPITLTITRQGSPVFTGETSTAQMKRRFLELVDWLGRDNHFPDGVFLLTGTGIVPGEGFTLQPGDVITIASAEIGTLANRVVQGR